VRSCKQGWAFQQIADRLEGKPVQVVDATVNDHRTVHEFSDAELTAILRRRVGVVPVENDQERAENGGTQPRRYTSNGGCHGPPPAPKWRKGLGRSLKMVNISKHGAQLSRS
jgi:hypothetical protein